MTTPATGYQETIRDMFVPESLVCGDGTSREIPLGIRSGRPLLLSLGVTRIVEQESIDVSIWASTDCEMWRQIAVYPRKYYCGTYLLLVDLARETDIRYLRVQWRMGSWGETGQKPVAAFYIAAEDLKEQAGMRSL